MGLSAALGSIFSRCGVEEPRRRTYGINGSRVTAQSHLEEKVAHSHRLELVELLLQLPDILQLHAGVLCLLLLDPLQHVARLIGQQKLVVALQQTTPALLCPIKEGAVPVCRNREPGNGVVKHGRNTEEWKQGE